MTNEEQKHYSRSNLIIAFIAGIVVGAGGYYLWSNPNVVRIENGNESTIADTDREKNTTASTADLNSLMVSDQPAGMKVHLTQITMEKGGWVAIYEDTEGVPGRILGAQRFDAGTYEGDVDLLRNTMEGNKYYAILHQEDGDKMFDHAKDMKMTDIKGAPIMATFSAIKIR